jgi:hypothetical protein
MFLTVYIPLDFTETSQINPDPRPSTPETLAAQEAPGPITICCACTTPF